jgi:hypothetical protein
VILIGLVADVISANRKLLEDLVYRVRSLELPGRSKDTDDQVEPPHAVSTTGTNGRWER